MWMMIEVLEIFYNVYFGLILELGIFEEQKFDILIECSDMGWFNLGGLELVVDCCFGKIS